MERLGECIGGRGGTWYHVHDGFFYKINSKRDNRAYLVCAIHKCPGRAVMPNNKADQIINNLKMTGLHNHPPNIHLPQLLSLKRTLKSRSESELTPLKQIFDEELAKVHESIHNLISYKGFKSTMQSYRHCVKKAILNALVGKEGSEFVEVSEIEDEENPVSEDNSGEIVQPRDKPDANRVKSKKSVKRPRRSIFTEVPVKKNKSGNDKEITFETFYCEEEETPADITFYDENYDENNFEDHCESQNEDLKKYLKFYQSKPKRLSDQCTSNDLLSTFFKEMEKTVRSFLPSVIIEAKSRIASLIHKLEMKNWQVQQLQEQKKVEKPKQVLMKEQTRQEQEKRSRLNAKMIIENQKELVQQQFMQQRQQKEKKVKKKNQKVPQPQEVFQQEFEEYYQLVDEQDQLTDEQNQLIAQEDLFVVDANQTIQEQPIANTEFAGGTVRVLGGTGRSTPGNFLNVRFCKAKIVPKKKLGVAKTVTE